MALRHTGSALLALALALAAPQGALAQDANEVLAQNWEQIKESARGGTVNWFMWGGSDTINAYVSEYLGRRAQQEYGVTLNRVGINDTAEAVNTVLSEVEAGVADDGSVDLIWINGENFRTMKQGGLVFCGYLGNLPNNALVDWSDPAIANDFGTPVDGCEVPWNRTQFAFGYNSERVPTPPASMGDLLAWIEANPGRFTYPAPPDFSGSVFVRHVFYHAAGDHRRLLGPFDQAVFDETAAKAWRILNELKPSLWRAGSTYPASVTAQAQLFANSEVDFHFSYDAATFGKGVDDGTFPPTTRSYGLSSGTIGNTNYVAIPINSPNKAAAMVVANLMLSAEAQLEKSKPGVWGASPAVDLRRLPAAVRAGFEDLPSHPSVVPADELAQASLPELQAEWVTRIEKGWQENVGK